MTASRYDLTGPRPIHQAAALRTVGFKVACSVEKDMASDGKTAVHWYVESAPADAADLCSGRPGADPATRHRAAMFRACMDALAIRDTLDVWLHSGADWYEITGTARPAHVADPATPCASIPRHLLDFAAAAIACGHLPRPRPNKGLPSLLITAAGGTTLPVLGNIESRLCARADGRVFEALTLPGHEPDEHPYFYAREAIAHAALCRAEERRATGNPTGLFRGRGGRTALVSRSILEAGDRSAELVGLHLTGQL